MNIKAIIFKLFDSITFRGILLEHTKQSLGDITKVKDYSINTLGEVSSRRTSHIGETSTKQNSPVYNILEEEQSTFLGWEINLRTDTDTLLREKIISESDFSEQEDTIKLDIGIKIVSYPGDKRIVIYDELDIGYSYSFSYNVEANFKQILSYDSFYNNQKEHSDNFHKFLELFSVYVNRFLISRFFNPFLSFLKTYFSENVVVFFPNNGNYSYDLLRGIYLCKNDFLRAEKEMSLYPIVISQYPESIEIEVIELFPQKEDKWIAYVNVSVGKHIPSSVKKYNLEDTLELFYYHRNEIKIKLKYDVKIKKEKRGTIISDAIFDSIEDVKAANKFNKIIFIVEESLYKAIKTTSNNTVMENISELKKEMLPHIEHELYKTMYNQNLGSDFETRTSWAYDIVEKTLTALRKEALYS